MNKVHSSIARLQDVARHTGVALTPMSKVGLSRDPRKPFANVTNASHLMGDPFGDVDEGDPFGDPFGDLEEGDPTDAIFGDIDETGDVGPLEMYDLISGDPRRKAKVIRAAKGLGLAAGGASLALIIRRLLALRRANKAKRFTTTARVAAFAKHPGRKFARDARYFFFNIGGAKIVQSPIGQSDSFVLAMMKTMLDRQNSDTPFQVDSTSAFANGAGVATVTMGPNCTAPAFRYFPAVFVRIGMNMLSGAPATNITVSGSLPLINGFTTDFSTTPFILNVEKGFDVSMLIVPWYLVQNVAQPALGVYNSTNPFTITVTGLAPTTSVLTVIIPGTVHKWVVAMRNRLLR